MNEIEELCDEILKRAYAMRHQSPNTCEETAEEMLEKITEFTLKIKLINSRSGTYYTVVEPEHYWSLR